MIPSIMDNVFLILRTVGHGQGGTRAGELDDKDEEEDHHVAEEHDLVVLHGSYQANNWDEEKEHSTGSDATDNRKTCEDSWHLAWNIKSWVMLSDFYMDF